MTPSRHPHLNSRLPSVCRDDGDTEGRCEVPVKAVVKRVDIGVLSSGEEYDRIRLNGMEPIEVAVRLEKYAPAKTPTGNVAIYQRARESGASIGKASALSMDKVCPKTWTGAKPRSSLRELQGMPTVSRAAPLSP